MKCVHVHVYLCRDSLATQLEESLTKADSEHLARSIAEEQYSDLEKEKILKELEVKDMMARHQQELNDKDNTISSVRQRQIHAVSKWQGFAVLICAWNPTKWKYEFIKPHYKIHSFIHLNK